LKLAVAGHFDNFFCVGVMYSGEYDACDVTLSVTSQEQQQQQQQIFIYLHINSYRKF
jgi:hypothetical protein